MTGGGPSFDYYIDSVNGSDSNSGTSLTTAKQTLNGPTYADNKRLALVAGSTWREGLNKSNTGLMFSNAGSGEMPLIDGSDVATGWTAHATLTDVWEKSWTHDATGTNRLTIYKDNSLLTRVADAATCSATPNSFVDVKGSSGATVTLQINVGSGANPTSFTIEASKRLNVLTLTGNNASVSGIHTRRAIDNNGSLDNLNTTGSSVSRILAEDGTKHNLAIGPGTATDCVAYHSDPPTSYETSNTMFVSYKDVNTSGSATFTRCFAVDRAPVAGLVGFYAHGASPPNDYISSATYDQCAVSGVYSGFSGLTMTRTITNCYSKKTPGPIGGNMGTLTVLRSVFDMSDPGNGLFAQINPTKLTAAAALNVEFVDCIFYSASANGVEMFRFGGTESVTFTNCIFYSGTANRPKVINSSAVAIALTCNGCIFYGPGNWMLDVSTAYTSYTGDNNVFYNPSGSVALRYHGTVITDIATWRSNTGQDAHSVIGNPGFSGTVANGDFRLTAGGNAALINSGVQNHWDWNARAIASGPPSAWPVIPETLADAKIYLANPSGWSF
jgi:hypothetical protein